MYFHENNLNLNILHICSLASILQLIPPSFGEGRHKQGSYSIL